MFVEPLVVRQFNDVTRQRSCSDHTTSAGQHISRAVLRLAFAKPNCAATLDP